MGAMVALETRGAENELEFGLRREQLADQTRERAVKKLVICDCEV